MPDRSWALQRKLMRHRDLGFNAEVYRFFRSVDDSAIPASRTALRDSLLIQANESRTSALFKVQYFREFVQRVHSKPSIIGVSKEQFDIGIDVTYKPIVTLYFQQDKAAVSPGFAPITAEISFRLMNESTETISKANIEALAKSIKNEFALGQGYTFNKGKFCCTYIDKENGYYLQLYVINKAEAISVARKIVGLRNHVFDENKLRTSEPERNSLNNPTNIVIAGETHKKSRWRPTGTVRFQWAYLSIHQRPDPIYLVDRTLSRPDSVELVY